MTIKAYFAAAVLIVFGTFASEFESISLANAEPPALSFPAARHQIKRSEPNAGIRTCQRLNRRHLLCRVVVTLAYEEELDGSELVRKRPIRQLIWMLVGHRGVEWALDRRSLD